jgi:hypothetical protein
MSGAWETQQSNHPQVLVATLTRELVTTAWAGGFRHLIIPGSFTFLAGMPFDMARNTACQKLLEVGWEWLFFLDDDTIPPPDAILRLMAHRQPIVSGLYYRRNSPICPVMLRDVPGGGRQWITEYKVPDLMPVDFVGSGCMLIHRTVLEKVPRPWFDWRVDRYDLPENQRMSEDFSFCFEARKCGYQILVDTSIQCKHCGLCESKAPGTLTPLELM